MTNDERNSVLNEVLAILDEAQIRMKRHGEIITIGGLIEAIERLRS